MFADELPLVELWPIMRTELKKVLSCTQKSLDEELSMPMEEPPSSTRQGLNLMFDVLASLYT